MPHHLEALSHHQQQHPQKNMARPSTASYAPLPTSESSSSSPPPSSERPLWLVRLYNRLPLEKFASRSVYAHYVTPRRRKRSLLRMIYWSIFSFPYLCLFLVLVAATLFPSYTHPPAHYNELKQRVLSSTTPGRANPNNEKIFIAASIYEHEGELTSGAWGQSVLQLIHILGPQNVHLSIYENGADRLTNESLARFQKNVTSNSTIVSDDLDLGTLPRVTLPNGSSRIKRIAFLSAVRNRALEPLATAPVLYDRILYINDVNFDPIDAAQLLLSTNLDPTTGRASYAAACAVDFINAFKFYDRFALRDMEGYGPGVPFYPWFTSAGSAISRNDVLSGTDAVRVRSCWGGMTAFEAKWFQPQTIANTNSTLSVVPQPHAPTSLSTTTTTAPPLRFRYDNETFWESSECCLINADLQYRSSGRIFPPTSDIYMNPYIRVAYDTYTLSWLSLSRRPERLYSMIHDILNYFVGFPNFIDRRTEEPGQEVIDRIWEYDNPERALAANATEADHAGEWKQVKRIAEPGGYCSTRQLLVINESPKEGEGRWSKILAPRPPL